MDPDTQRSKAVDFRELHRSSDIFVLPCAWDVASARLFEEAGFPAVGTSSAGIANALGYPDGQRAPLEEILAVTDRIVDAVSIPVSADLESGYADSVDEAVENVRAALDVGIVGINLEDGTWPDADPLVDPSVMTETIESISEMADSEGVPLIVNARTDAYIHGDDQSPPLDRAVTRVNSYRDAGADCSFVPGVSDPDLIADLVDAIDGPLNVLASHQGVPSVPKLDRLGVDRVSLGPGPMYAAMGSVRRIGEELLETGTYTNFEGAIPYPEMQNLFASDDALD